MTATEPAVAHINQALVQALRDGMLGQVIDRVHAEYDEARKVWNGLIDRYPAVIARVASTSDVVHALQVAERFRPDVSVRGGGHQVAGSAISEGGLVIDLSALRDVEVDAVARTARVGPGARWADVDQATQRFGMVVPGGEVSHTGVAGLTLGGGMGRVMRAYGLSSDNLRSLEIVTADGVVRTASGTDHPDLFWAARGGGRGIGVVTSFEFEMHPLGPDVATALVFYPYEQARQVAYGWRDLTRELPDAVAPELVLWSVPPDPAIPAELHGTKVVIVAATYAGDATEGVAALAPLAQLGTPLIDASGIVPYMAAQTALDAAFPDGGRYYFKSHFLDRLEDQAIDTMLAFDRERPNPQSLMVLRTLGGAIDRVSPDSSAYPHRGARYNLSIDAAWFTPELDVASLDWARMSWAAMRPFANGGVYLNFAGLDSETGRAPVYGSSARRLEEIRRTYDPRGILAHAASQN